MCDEARPADEPTLAGCAAPLRRRPDSLPSTVLAFDLHGQAARRTKATASGHDRQHTWMRQITPQTDAAGLVTRGLLAAHAADPDTATLDNILANARPARRQLAITKPVTTTTARTAYEHAARTAAIHWLTSLRTMLTA